MKKRELLVPVVTPFRADESVNYGELKKLVRKVLNEGADGIYVCGGSSEFVLLTHEERKEILETVISAADGAYVAAHVGAASTAEAVALARHAKKAGADCIASVPPYWYKYSFVELCGYFTALADAGLPVMVYNIPASSKVSFTQEEFCALFRDERIFGMKFTDTNFRDAFRKGENERALRVMASANNVTETIIARCLPCTKYVLTLQGIDAGECRGPFAPVTEEEKRAIRTAFENNL